METAMKKLTDRQMTKVNGGGNDVLGNCEHKWIYTGNEREGWLFFFWTQHEKEQYCTVCRTTRWVYED